MQIFSIDCCSPRVVSPKSPVQSCVWQFLTAFNCWIWDASHAWLTADFHQCAVTAHPTGSLDRRESSRKTNSLVYTVGGAGSAWFTFYWKQQSRSAVTLKRTTVHVEKSTVHQPSQRVSSHHVVRSEHLRISAVLTRPDQLIDNSYHQPVQMSCFHFW